MRKIKTEENWQSIGDASALLNFASKDSSDRKFRLFGCACLRSKWDLFAKLQFQRVVEATEEFADELISKFSLRSIRQSALKEMKAIRKKWDSAQVRNATASAVRIANAQEVGCKSANETAKGLVQAVLSGPEFVGIRWKNAEAEARWQAGLVRDIFGNPFRPVTLDPRWQSSTVLDLARTIYEQRTFEHLPILADALMDAGCDSEAIIQHCQGPGPHVRGCWVVDLLLGKE